MIRRSIGALTASVLLLVTLVPAAVVAQAPVRPHAPLPASIKGARLPQPLHDTKVAQKAKIATSLEAAHGKVRVFVRLSSAPAAESSASGAAAVMSQVRVNRSQQTRLIAQARQLDGGVRVLGRTDRASNTVALRIDSSTLKKLAKDPSVLSITPVVDYQLALSETVPYIGATAVQKAGFKGLGIKVGVIDSGIDYTHVAFGGAGTPAAYAAGLRQRPERPQEHDARRPVPDGPCRRRLRLRRRELAGRRRDRGSRSRPDRLRGPWDARGGHHRRQARRGPAGEALRAQGLLGGRDGVLRRRTARGGRLGGRSEPRRRHPGSSRHPQHVARRGLHLGLHRRPGAGGRPGQPGRRPDGRRRREWR